MERNERRKLEEEMQPEGNVILEAQVQRERVMCVCIRKERLVGWLAGGERPRGRTIYRER